MAWRVVASRRKGVYVLAVVRAAVGAAVDGAGAALLLRLCRLDVPRIPLEGSVPKEETLVSRLAYGRVF